MMRKFLTIACLLLASAGAEASCPTPNTFPFQANCPLPAAELNAAIGTAGGTFFNAKDYIPEAWDGATTSDVGPSINLALAASVAAGGGCVMLPPGNWYHSTKITASANDICMFGAGPAGVYGDGGTGLRWNGAAGGEMMLFAPPYGSTSNQRMYGLRLANFTLNGNAGLAANGLHMQTTFMSSLDNLSFVGGFNGGKVLWFDVVPAVPGVTFGEAIAIQNWVATNTEIDNRGGFTSNGIYFSNYTSGGVGQGNASWGTFNGTMIQGDAGCGIYSGSGDNVTFLGTTRVRNTNCSIDLNFGPVTPFKGTNGFIFDHVVATGPIYARGQQTVPTCTPQSAGQSPSSCTHSNEFRAIDQTNNSETPTVETGAELEWCLNNGRCYGKKFFGTAGLRPGVVISNSSSTIGTCNQNGLTYGVNASAYLCNTSGGPLLFFDDLSSGDRFKIKLDGTAGSRNLQFSRTTGAGSLQFGRSIFGIAATFPPTSAAQATGGSTLLPFADLATSLHIAVGQIVEDVASLIPPGTKVASIAPNEGTGLVANGVSAAGQKVVTTTSTGGAVVGDACHDSTQTDDFANSVFGANNRIASINAGVSITVTSNLLLPTANLDRIECGPIGVTLAANGISASGQKVITVTSTTNAAVGQQCRDTTTTTAIGAGNVIASISAGVSITMTSNLVAATANADAIVCDPVVTLTKSTTAAIPAATVISFYANLPSFSKSSGFYAHGDISINGDLFIAGATQPIGGVAAAGGFSVSPRNWATCGVGSNGAAAAFTDQTPVATEVYIAEIFVPANATVTGVGIRSGSVASGNVKVGLANSAGVQLKTSASTAVAGAAGVYQLVPFSGGSYSIVGPATYYVETFYDNNTVRGSTHTQGVCGAAVQTGQVFATGFTTITPPTTFTTAVGPVANLY